MSLVEGQRVKLSTDRWGQHPARGTPGVVTRVTGNPMYPYQVKLDGLPPFINVLFPNGTLMEEDEVEADYDYAG